MITIITPEKKYLFTNEKSLLNFCKEIKNSYKKGDECSKEHSEFLKVFFAERANLTEDEKNNIKLFKVIRHPVRGNAKKFCIVFNDDTLKNMSISDCFKKKKSSHKTVKEEFRRLIHDQINTYKKTYMENTIKKGMFPCEVSGVLCTSSNVDVDHVNQFSSIMSNFLKERNIDIATIELDENHAVIDKNLINDWREYHKQHAILRVVEKQVHHKNVNAKMLNNKPKYVFYSEPDWFVAENVEQFKTLRNEAYDDDINYPYTILKDDDIVTVSYDSMDDVPLLLQKHAKKHDENIIVEATAKLFAVSCDCGLLCSKLIFEIN